MSKLAGKVAFLTGAARGQGRSHAVRLAEEGARIIAVDICADIDSVHYSMATEDDLAETASEVRSRGGQIVTGVADVRDAAALRAALDAGIAEFGGVDVVVANAGIAPMSVDEPAGTWQDTIDINLTGVFNTVEAALPSMTAAGRGGSIVLISSTAGNNGVGGPTPGGLAYTASKHGVVGLMRSYANILAGQSIRVNAIHPSAVSTPMVVNEGTAKWLEAFDLTGGMSNAMPVELLEPADISHAVAWLASDEARYVTGVSLPVDGGASNKR